MRPFIKNPSCPKCEWADIQIKHEWLTTLSDERLACRCNRCDYKWTMEVKDEPAKDIGE